MCDMRWGSDMAVDATLRGVSLRIRRGGVVAVVGGVGSGKSSLLEGLLGELDVRLGIVGPRMPFLSGRVAYVSQQAYGTGIRVLAMYGWECFAVRNASVRENILFDSSYDADLYAMAIAAAALDQDIASFPAGDLTEIGMTAT